MLLSESIDLLRRRTFDRMDDTIQEVRIAMNGGIPEFIFLFKNDTDRGVVSKRVSSFKRQFEDRADVKVSGKLKNQYVPRFSDYVAYKSEE